MELVNLVDAGEIDMAAVIRPPFDTQNSLQWTNFAHEPFRLVVPRQACGSDYRTLMEELPFIRYDRTSFGGRLVDRFLREKEITVNDICELDELEAILQLVINGMGQHFSLKR